MPVQITYQQISSHHQFLTKGSRSKMHVQHLILYVKFTCIRSNDRSQNFCPRVDKPPFIQRRLQTFLPEVISCLRKLRISFPICSASFRFMLHFPHQPLPESLPFPKCYLSLHGTFYNHCPPYAEYDPNVHDWYLL